MALPKGRTNNANGRPKGTKNKRTQQWDALGEAIANEHTTRFNKHLSSMWDSEPDKAMEMYIKTLEYFKPKQSRVEANVQGEQEITVRIIKE